MNWPAEPIGPSTTRADASEPTMRTATTARANTIRFMTISFAEKGANDSSGRANMVGSCPESPRMFLVARPIHPLTGRDAQSHVEPDRDFPFPSDHLLCHDAGPES